MTEHIVAAVAGSRWVRTFSSSTPSRGSVGCVRAASVCLTLFLAATGTSTGRSQDASNETKPDARVEESAAPAKPTPPARLEPEKGWLRVAKNYEVWVDYQKRQVIAGGRICLREGLLEMFACPKGTKEHESIVSVHAPARFVHGALLALGAQPGPPVQFEPIYKPAQGTEIVVEVFWRDADGKEHRVNAQEWVKHVKTGEALAYPWVFAGSGFWTDEEGKERFYYADGGDFICVSNFSTATMDLPIESSAANDALMFCAFTDRIPPRDTPVLLFMTPKLEKSESTAAPADAGTKKETDKDSAGSSGGSSAGSSAGSPGDASDASDAKTPAAEPTPSQPERAITEGAD
jgi:hypothetical protein